MAKEFYMSRSYLSKRFKAESNITLTDFILNRKTEEAKHLLRYTDKPLTAISLDLGFSSPGHFSRVFRKYVSMSPSDYRKKKYLKLTNYLQPTEYSPRMETDSTFLSRISLGLP